MDVVSAWQEAAQNALNSAHDLFNSALLIFGEAPPLVHLSPPIDLQFDDFHIILLETFLLILFVTLILIFLSWKLYGERISERFMKPATSKAIQELKESVSRLKLPKEHTPRI